MSGTSRKREGTGARQLVAARLVGVPHSLASIAAVPPRSTASWSLRGHLFKRKIPKFLDRHRANVPLTVTPHGHHRRLRLLVADDQHVRGLLELGLADLPA